MGKVKTSVVCIALAFVLLLSGCGAGAKAVNLRKVARQDMGNAVPEILFASLERVVFRGEFGLFVVNTADGSFYRTLDLGVLGSDHMTGPIITRFLVGEDENTIYFYNDGDGMEDGGPTSPYAYLIEENELVKDAEIGATLPPLKAYAEEFIGGNQGGYISNLAYADENTIFYLRTVEWTVADITLRRYDVGTGQTTEFPLFAD